VIIETFAKMRELSRNINNLSIINDEEEKREVLKKSGEIFSELFDDDLKITDTETSVEFNFAIVKFKHLIKKKKDT